jgi:ABC-type transporter Mla maintaining outer membrane lipid asymmetry ATPase subunit MlaF
MLLDEPFAGIDPIAIDDIQRIIARLRDRGIGCWLQITTCARLWRSQTEHILSMTGSSSARVRRMG